MPQLSTTGRGYSKQILRIVCGSGRQRPTSSRENVRRALYENGKSSKRPRVVRHNLTPEQLKKRVDTCTLLLDRAANTQWTCFIIAQDEK